MSAAEDGNHRLSVVALIGLGGSGAMFGVHAAILAAVAINVDDVSADAAKFFLVMSSTVLSMGGAFLVAHLAAVNALAIRTGLLPRWLTVVGLVSAALFLVASLGTAIDSDAVMLFGFGGFIVWLVWILGTSAQMWRTADALPD
jgi:prepilin signal peptidase PulO-like enzyme (type II secretory pathway)